jgi:hypothetical protein
VQTDAVNRLLVLLAVLVIECDAACCSAFVGLSHFTTIRGTAKFQQ